MWQLQLHFHEQVNMWKIAPPLSLGLVKAYILISKWPVWSIWDGSFSHSKWSTLIQKSLNGNSAAPIETGRMDSSGAGGGSSFIIPSVMRRKCFLLHFHLHLLLICIYSYIKSDGGPLKTWVIPQLFSFFFFKWLNWQGWIWCNMEDLAFFKLTSDCFFTQCDVIQYIMAVQKWHHLHYWCPKSLVCSMFNRLVLALFYFLRKIRADNIQLVMSHYYSAQTVKV